MLRWLASAPALFLVAACVGQRPDAHVHYSVSTACGARAACFGSLQAALDAAEAAVPGQWLAIDIAPGSYAEKVTVRRPRTRLSGAGSSRTFLRFGAVAETSGRYHRDHWGTPGSATLTIDADDVVVEGLTVENTFDFLANDALADGDPRKLANSQAVALLLDRHSDRVLLERVALLGYQDTLFADGRRAIVRRSLVAGNIDFIFGRGELLVADSTIRTRPRAARFEAGDVQSIIAAPSTPSAQAMGIVFYRSRLEREPGVPDGVVALARPWHPTRTFPDGRYADPDAIGQASYIDCWMDAHIHPDHWTSMPGTAPDGTKSRIFTPRESRFFEQGSRGPGARRVGEGPGWNAALSMEEVRRVMSADWPAAGRIP